MSSKTYFHGLHVRWRFLRPPCILWGMALLKTGREELLFATTTRIDWHYFQKRQVFTHAENWKIFWELSWQQQLCGKCCLVVWKGPYLITDQFDIVWRTFKDCFCARITITNTIIKCFYQDKGFKKALTIFLMNSRQEHNEILGHNVLK